MAFIKINPEGMLTVINNLDERADGIATERKKSTTPAETTTIQCLPWTWPLAPPPIPASWTRARDRELSAPVPRLCTVWLRSCVPAVRRPST